MSPRQSGYGADADRAFSDLARHLGISGNQLRGLGFECFPYLTHFDGPAIKVSYRDAGGRETAARFLDPSTGRRAWRQRVRGGIFGLDRVAASNFGPVHVARNEIEATVLTASGHDAVVVPDGNETVCLDVVGERPLRVLWESSEPLDRAKRWDVTGSYTNARIQQAGPLSLPWARDGLPAAVFIAAAENDDCDLGSVGEFVLSADAVERESLWPQCERLARDPRILRRLREVMSQLGVTGESDAAELLYLCFTTRVLPMPTSAVLRAGSSTGKSYVLNAIQRLLPKDAYVERTALSPKALAHSDVALSHRFLVVAEYEGVRNTFGEFVLRVLLSEGVVRYEHTISRPDGEFDTRVAQIDGPTGLIITTTRHTLHPENETRLLAISLSESNDQTLAILAQQAEMAEGNAPDPSDVDLTEWRAFQRWIALGPRKVRIPYARKLVALIDDGPLRLRRDMPKVFGLIKASALLHQCHRERAADGAVIANLRDYRIVRRLVNDLVSEGVGSTVPERVRRIVGEVERLSEAPTSTADGQEGVTVAVLARRLGVHKATVGRHVELALSLGYLTNLARGGSNRYFLAVGDPLPINQKVLPPASELA